VKKLFNKSSGSLKEKFEGLEETPSLKSWRKLEAELAVLNAGIVKRKRRKRAAYFMAAASIGLLIFMVNGLNFDQNQKYQKRAQTVIQNADLSSENNWSFHINLGSNVASSNRKEVITRDALAFTSDQPEIEKIVDENRSVGQTEMKEVLLSKVQIDYEPIPVNEINFEPEHLEMAKPKTTLSSKWRINLSGGQDVSRNAFAPRSAAAFAGGNNARPLQSWSFEPYTHQLPVVLSAGVERRITKRLSAHISFDYQMMRAVANTPYQLNNRSAIKKGRLNQFGMAVGLNAEVIQRNRIRAYIGVEAWAAHATNSYTEITQLNGKSTEAKVSEVQLTPSSILSARATAGLKYRLTEKMSLTGCFMATKPIHNYINELNVYNNGEKYIPGVRMGISLAI
jgi:hypothetical protein